MKIISKYKDYYDYLQGIYGIDKTQVFDRRFEYYERPESYLKYEHHKLDIAICGQYFSVHLYNGKFYHLKEELLKLDEILKKNGEAGLFFSYKNKSTIEKYWKAHNGPTDINNKLRFPVLMSTRWEAQAMFTIIDQDKNEQHYTSVLLKDYGFPRWYPADEIYQKISAFISYLKDYPEIPNKQTDKEKILSHGFDYKKSFRHRK